MRKNWYKDLPGALLNACTVAGITALSLMAGAEKVSGPAVGVAFGLSFLIELRKFVDLKRLKP